MESLDESEKQMEDALKLFSDSYSEFQLEVEQLKKENAELKQQLQCKVECGGESDQKPAEILNGEEGNKDLQNKVEPLDSKLTPKERLQKEIEEMMMTHRFETFEKTETHKMTILKTVERETSRLEALVREKEGCIETLESEREHVLNLMMELRVSSEFPEIEGSPFLEQLEKVVVHIKKKLCEYRGICKFLHEKLLNRVSKGFTKRPAQIPRHEAISVSPQTSKGLPVTASSSSSVLQYPSSNLFQQVAGPHAGPSSAATPSDSVTSGINVQEPRETQITMQHPSPNSKENNLTIRLTKTRDGQDLGKVVWKVVHVGTSHVPESPIGPVPPPGGVSLSPVSPGGDDEENVDPIRKLPPPPGQSRLSPRKSSVSPEGIKVTKCLGTMNTNESNHIPLAMDPPPLQKEVEKDEEIDMETTATDTFIPPHPPQTPLPTVHPSTSAAFGSEPVVNEMITRAITSPNLPTTQLYHQEVAQRTSHELPSASRKFQCQFCGNEFRSGENQKDHTCPTLHSSKQPNHASIVDEDDEDVVILSPPSSRIIANEEVLSNDVEIIDLTSDVGSPPHLVVQTNTPTDQNQLMGARDGEDDSMTSSSTATAHGCKIPEPQTNLSVTNDNASANLGPTTEPLPPQPFPSTSQSSSQTPVRNRILHGVNSKKKNTCICGVPYGNKEQLQNHIEIRRGENW